MSDINIICRLCKNTKFLNNLNEMDNNGTSLYMKASFCLDIMIHTDDGLPTMICRYCKRKINKFYRFKQKCFEVDLELRQHLEKEIQYESNYTEHGCKQNNFKNDNYNLEETKFHNQILDKDEVNTLTPFVTNSIVHEDNTETSIQCELCGMMFDTKTEYKKHVSSLHGETKLYQCKYCPKRFTRSESNATHMRSHLGIRPFICVVCGQSSTKKQDLMRHMKIHTDERNHECQICGRKFKRSGDLCSHIRTHTGARPYKCRMCDKDYTSHSGLRKHIKTHSKNEIHNVNLS